MATRATIGMVTDEGYIRYIYSHWDGYLDGVGATLLENYNTTAQVEELLEMGDVSILEDSIENSKFYHRDWGELLNTVCALETDSLSDLGQEFNYVWTGDEWIVGFDGLWYRLAYIIQAEIANPERLVFGKVVA